MSESEIEVDEFDDDVIIEDVVAIKKSNGRKFVYERLSASMMKTWLSCKRKFHQTYIDGIKSPPQAQFTLGTAVHYALETANRSLMKDPRELTPMEIASYLRLFVNLACREYTPDPRLFNEGSEMLKVELSSENTISEKIIGIEDEFDLVTPEGVRIYGFMDKLVEVDSETIKIIDYKTSKTAMSYDDAKQDYQLAMYDLAVSIKYPQYTNRLMELRYLRPGTAVKVRRNSEEQYNFRILLAAVNAAIKEYVSVTKEAPDGTINDFCNWCSYNNNCKQYVDRVNTFLPEAPSTHALTDSTFIDTWDKVNSILKAAEAWKERLKIWAVERLNEDPETKIQNSGREVITLSTTLKEYDVATVGKLIPIEDLLGLRTGEPLVKINKKKLENYLTGVGDRKLTKKIDDSSIVKVSAPQIRVKGNNK